MNLSRLGTFWLPDRPDNKVVGVVDIEDESRPVLRLHGGFEGDRRGVFSPGDVFHLDVHGVLQNPGEECSLHGVNFLFPDCDYSMAHINALVLGDHVRCSDSATRCRFSLPLGRVVEDVNRAIHYTNHEELAARHDVRRTVIVEFEAAGAHISIRSGASIRHRFEDQVTEYGVAHRVDVEVADAVEWTDLPREIVAPLRHLVALLTTFLPRVDDFSFDLVGAPEPDLDAVQFTRGARTEDGAPVLGHQLVFPHWQSGGAPSERYERYTSAFGHLMSRADVPTIEDGLARWWRWARIPDNEEVLQAANRTAALKVRSERDEFSDAVGALELFGDRLQPDSAEHDERCDRLAELIPHDDPDRDWAVQRLRSGGGFGLRKKFKTLRERYTAGSDLLGDNAQIEAMLTARNLLSHGKRPQDGFQLRQVAHQLRQFLIIAALTEAASPPNAIES